jgi:hypothetical protein
LNKARAEDGPECSGCIAGSCDKDELPC